MMKLLNRSYSIKIFLEQNITSSHSTNMFLADLLDSKKMNQYLNIYLSFKNNNDGDCMCFHGKIPYLAHCEETAYTKLLCEKIAYTTGLQIIFECLRGSLL